MSEHTIQPWIAANEYMDDEYREIIVDLALRHLPRASKDLQKLANRQLTDAVQVPGFRNIRKVPITIARRHVQTEFAKNGAVASLIVCLWAEALQDLIDNLVAKAGLAGFSFNLDWNWKKACAGYYDYDDIPALDEFVNSWIEGMEKPERDHYMLAVLWLSRALLESQDGDDEERSVEEDEIVSTDRGNGASDIEGDVEKVNDADPLEDDDDNHLQDEVDDTSPSDEEKALETIPEALPDLSVISLNDLCELWEAQSKNLQDANLSVITAANELKGAAEQNHRSQARQLYRSIQERLDAWDAQSESYAKFAQAALARIIQEYELRPDLEKSELLANDPSAEKVAWDSFPAQAGKDAIQAVLAYDRRREELEKEVNNVREEIVKTQQALLVWQKEPVENGPFFTELDETDEMTLSELEKISYQARVLLQTLSASYTQLREQCINRTRAHIAKLNEITPDDLDVQTNGFDLSTLIDEDFSGWADNDLRSIEEKLLQALNERVVQDQRGSSASLAARLKEEWDEQVLAELVDRLAVEKREIEAFLLELAATKSHPRNVPNTYSKGAVANLLNGLGQVSSKTKPFELSGWIAPTFLTGFRGQEDQSQAEVCLVALAAHLSSEYLQPSGYLWQVASDWPLEDMPGWQKLWQSVLLEAPAQIFTDQKEAALKEVLDSSRKEAEQALARDGAHFIRLSSLQSNRHRSLLMNELLPALEEKLNQLKRLNDTLKNGEPERLPSILEKLQRAFNDKIAPELQEDVLIKQYESGLYQEGIDDNETFHRRVSIRIYQDCAEAVLNYGNALLEYWELKDARSNGLKSIELKDELVQLPELTALGQAAVDQIIQSQAKERIAWNENYANRQSTHHIVQEALTQPSFAMHLPRLVGRLVNQFLDWDAILVEVINDIAEPLGLEAAAYLLEADAPTQALMFVQYLPLEKQKRAQEKRSEFERQINALLPELLQLGGEIDSFSTWHSIGRWGYLLGKISEEIEILREIKESRSREIAQKSLGFRQSINNIDMELFKIKPDLPQGIYELISQGITAARHASEMEELFPKVEEFLREMDYRLEHRSWYQEELHTSVNGLKKAISRSIDPPSIQVTAEQLKKFLDNGQLEELNLSGDRIAPSAVNTRIDLLHNWHIVKELKGLVREDLHATGVMAIQNLFRYFAQMMAMKKYRVSDGKDIAFLPPPIVYETWQLQFPRTAALDKLCVMIALPGNPPAVSNIKLLQDFIEEREFLEGDFVFLLVPGCDEKVTRRYQGMTDGKGLVLIDEAALVRMILAEAQDSIPLGRLRPMMLDAINANTNIFTVNQTVDTRTAIFLGRDYLIDKIVRSGENYPIYGGRRIGKSSLLKAVEQRLGKNIQVVSYTLEGNKDLRDEAVSLQLAEIIGLDNALSEAGEFKIALFQYMDDNPDKNLVIMLDEVDRYIQVNKERHTMIEALRAASDRYGNRFRVIIAGFMELFDCLSGRGPYTQTSDPWRRMLDNDRPLGNLTSVNAEAIVKEGFLSILGWKFENRAIPQLIVERTGGHPAFVQDFCLKVLERVRSRGDREVRISDIDAVFTDNDPTYSFIAYVRETLEMNLDAVGRYVVVMLASRPKESMGFTWDELCEIAEASDPPIPDDYLKRSLEYLSVTSVVHEVSKQVYEYTVPDYPNILQRLGDTNHLDELEDALKTELEGDLNAIH